MNSVFEKALPFVYGAAIDRIAQGIGVMRKQTATQLYKPSPAYGTLIVGFVIGTLCGAIAALLMAPDRGEVIRENLGDRFDDTWESVREKMEPLYGEKEFDGLTEQREPRSEYTGSIRKNSVTAL